MRRATTGLFFGLVLFTVNSCRQPSTPSETANIHGRVELVDNPWFTPPYSGVTVALEGTGYSAMSDDSGYFTLKNVPSGTYNVRFSKPGYGDVRWMSTTVTGGGNTDVYWPLTGSWTNQYSQLLYPISKVVTALDGLRFLDTTVLPRGGNATSGPMFMASGTALPDLTQPQYPQYYEAMALYVSHSSDVSAQPGHYATFFYGSNVYAFREGTNNFVVTAPIDTTTGRFHLLIMQTDLKYFGFKSGDSIYVAAYGAPTYGGFPANDYWDPILQQYVLTAINQTPSPVIGTVVP
ncbi:MAG: carboxypeptidase-like regulatory domain-containing protein [Bacteroidota bacterium]|nr:carboxypeptidase-like regulatory domain-containing protein [Bacteroidota bacterium]MDP4233496.1 carboxypeptidase-like regulatory domain-containing protein [Bacteroidota bacterium]MDP4243373.1 carboxypeptidase-like regulatory domain-containing protein [Bacteroidota bacterium]MDP4287940.1 carboxypeptidase-like regulatory domain-containing protein [Bacteroidota bacterium]